MADCDLCTRAVVTLNPVSVVSNSLAYRETGKWKGLCDECLKSCRDALEDLKDAEGKKCDLCREKKSPLYVVVINVPSVSTPYKVDKMMCKGCLDAAGVQQTGE